MTARALAVLTFVAACRNGAAVPHAPMLPPTEAEKAARPPTPTMAPVAPGDPTIDADLGTPPASAPSGNPIAVTIAPPQVGDRRVREVRDLYLVDNVLSDGERSHQRTETTFDLEEEYLAVDAGAPTRISVHVNTAHESLRLGSTHQEMPLLVGSYVVKVAPPADPDDEHARVFGRGLPVTRTSGATVHGREQEELSSLYSTELGQPDRALQLVVAKKLRLGEIVELSTADKKLFIGEEPKPTPIFFGVVAADATTATYQFDARFVGDAVFEKDAKETTRVRDRITLERATGRVRERVTITTRAEPSHTTVSHHRLRFTYR